MKFVTADSCRLELEKLTQLLVSEFPGSTIYQHTDLLRVPHDALSNRVDAILLSVQPDEIDGLDCVKMLRREKPDVPVFLIAKTEEIRKAAEETGITGCFVLPDCGRQLLDAIHRVNCKERLL